MIIVITTSSIVTLIALVAIVLITLAIIVDIAIIATLVINVATVAMISRSHRHCPKRCKQHAHVLLLFSACSAQGSGRCSA